MIKILGALDILASAVIFLSLLNLKWNILLIIFAVYLLIKGVVFIIASFDVACLIDIFSAIILALMIFITVPEALIILAGILLLQKGIFSLL